VLVQVVPVRIFDVTAGELGELSGRPLVVTLIYVIVNDGYKLVDISLIKKRFVTTTDNYSAFNLGDKICNKIILVFFVGVLVPNESLVDVKRAGDFRYCNAFKFSSFTDALLAQEPFLVIGYLDKLKKNLVQE
jgi:hypothetical protein